MRLKHLALGLVLTVLAAVPVSAQTFDFGLEAGANFSNFLGNDASSPGALNGYKLGFVGGAFLSLNIGNVIAIRPEILYEQKGVQYTGTSSTTELDYVEVPILLKLSLGLPLVNPAIILGPSFAWNTVAQSGGNDLSGVNTSDVGLVGGLEFDISKFFISGRYELGLDNVTTGKNIQNGTITVLMGYSFF